MKTILLGNCKTGKTAFVKHLIDNIIPEYEKTIEFNQYLSKPDSANLYILDSIGNDCYLSMLLIHIVPSNIILSFIDPTDSQYIKNLIQFYNIIIEKDYSFDEKLIAVIINVYKYDGIE